MESRRFFNDRIRKHVQRTDRYPNRFFRNLKTQNTARTFSRGHLFFLIYRRRVAYYVSYVLRGVFKGLTLVSGGHRFLNHWISDNFLSTYSFDYHFFRNLKTQYAARTFCVVAFVFRLIVPPCMHGQFIYDYVILTYACALLRQLPSIF